MREIQIYIKGQRVDVFGDENVTMKSSIQDAKDISKVFTDYSQPFTLPASDTNNKIFRHFYNTSITGNAFDGRVRHEAKIFINHLLFKKGKMFLNGVNMKNGKASSYNVTFFGNTVSLKDLFKDDKIETLSDYKKGVDGTDAIYKLNELEFDWSSSSIQALLETGQTFQGDATAMIAPLITPKKRLFYNSSLSDSSITNFDGNLYRPADPLANPSQFETRGVKAEDLKPAIKVYHIIRAIQEKYNINFLPNDTSGTKDFFSIHNEAFTNLYLWMSNNSGNITGNLADDNYLYVNEVNSWTPDTAASNYDSSDFDVDGNEIVFKYPFKTGRPRPPYTFLDILDNVSITIQVDPDSAYDTIKWRVRLINTETGDIVGTTEGSGSVAATIKVPDVESWEDEQRYKVEFSSEASMSSTELHITYRVDRRAGLSDLYEVFTSGADVDSDVLKFKPSNHFPDIEIMDFMSGLFKMFNLTAYYIDDESDPQYSETTPVVKVITLDDYYADAINNQSKGTIDVTKYIDVSKSTINTSLPFSEIDFKFEEADTILMANHKEINGYVYGNSSINLRETYRGLDLFYGEKYEVELPFSKLKYERINGTQTDIVWGYAAGGDFSSEDTTPPKANYKPEDIKPLLFYGIRETNISTPINFSSTTSNRLTDYWRPSNTNETVVPNEDGVFEDSAAYSINFDSEVDEWSLTESINSLFEVFYKKYITSVFDIEKRVFKYSAYMPPSFLIHYRLNDQLKVQDKVFRINSISTNLTTGKTELELINLNPEEIV